LEKKNALAEKLHTLPSPSRAFGAILATLSREESSVEQCANALKQDPAVAAKALRLANSAYFGMPHAVSSLDKTVVLLGRRRLYALTIASQFLSKFAPKNLPFNIVHFWEHSLAAALISESIARHLRRYDALDAGELFCAGLLHDIGKLALGVYAPRGLLAAYEKAAGSEAPFWICEAPEAAHTVTGAIIGEKWRFPESLNAAFRYHHAPYGQAAHCKQLAIVHVADASAHVLGYQTAPGECAPAIDERAFSLIGLPPERLGAIASQTIADHRRIESLLRFFA
jgi:putative nucleotidyltransferase with HDIG domain